VVVLNIETVAAAAPGAHIVVYFAPNTDRGFTDAINAAAADDANNPSVLCIAWGTPESSWTDATVTAIDRALAKAAARGITVCCAAGDNGPTDGVLGREPHVDFPASSPYALACGGTRISVSGGRIAREVAWNDLAAHMGATGGGFSRRFGAPPWQEGGPAATSSTPEAAPGRGLPDVAANASVHSGYRIILNGQSIVIGGTSAVVGLWAGLIARINQGLGERVGYLNPVLYRNLGPAGVLRDITEGSTTLDDGSGLGCDARPGWDPCTGWGSPNGERLLAALRLLQTTRPPRDERPAG
jgi:kumamolisin